MSTGLRPMGIAGGVDAGRRAVGESGWFDGQELGPEGAGTTACSREKTWLSRPAKGRTAKLLRARERRPPDPLRGLSVGRASGLMWSRKARNGGMVAGARWAFGGTKSGTALFGAFGRWGSPAESMLAERWLARSDGLAARTAGHSLGAKPEAAVKGVSRPGGLRAHPTRAYLQFWGSGRFEWKVIGQGKRFSLAAAQIWLKVRNCFGWGLRPKRWGWRG
jgi:hypothetical protein